MIGSIVGAALSVGSSILGGVKASKEMNKVKGNLNSQLKDNQDWYDRMYNEDATQRADAQAILNRTEEAIKQRNQSAAANQAVLGGTDESIAATKQANNQALADAVSDIAVNSEKRKDAIESQYQKNKTELSDQLNNVAVSKANAIAAATKGVADSGAKISDNLDGNIKKKDGATNSDDDTNSDDNSTQEK